MIMLKILKLSCFLYKLKVPFASRALMNLNRIIFSCSVPYTIVFGKNLRFGHSGLGVVINGDVKIGNNCLIGTGVVIGGSNKINTVPTIGNNVYIATGAKIIGAVKIGNNVVVAANAVVINDVPDNTLVAGVPAQVKKQNIKSKDYF